MQITSLFLHWFPACVAWTERWHPEIHASHASRKPPEAMQEWDAATVAQLILFPSLPYLLWAILYYIKVEHLSGSMTTSQHGCAAAGALLGSPSRVWSRVTLHCAPAAAERQGDQGLLHCSTSEIASRRKSTPVWRLSP